MFKKLLFIVLSLLIMTSCQNEQLHMDQKPDINPKDVKLETSSANGFIIEQDNDSVFHAAVAFKNTGKVPVRIKNVQLNVESGEGTKLGTVTPLTSTPVILKPGEVSIAGGTAPANQTLSSDEFGKVEVKVDYEPTTQQRSEWEISDIHGEETPYGYMVTGKAKNTTKEKVDEVYVTVGLFNDNDYILAALTSYVEGPINPGETVDFQTVDYFHVPKYILDKVDHIEAKAIGFKEEE